ncbi:MAG: hypothetical protein AB1483_09710 [Candidatus Zixiibacteriota bacterium]
MKSRFIITVAAAAVLSVALVIAGCGSSDEPVRTSVVDEMIDSLSSAVSKNINEAALPSTTPMEARADLGPVKLINEVAGLKLVGGKLYGVFDGGVAAYDIENKTYTVIPSKEKLRAVEAHDGKVYVGGDNLYTVKDSVLERVDGEFGVITSLYSYGYRLMIGTETGLHATGIFGNELVFEDVPVSAIAADETGLWVGTSGEGLYRWDGEEFHKRFLRRDTSLFDYVNTLAFNHNHLYMGTDNGFHIFDGGSWKTLTSTNDLPSDKVTSVDASGWVVYVGTDCGVVSYFDGEIIPVDKLGEVPVNALAVDGRKVFAATDHEGILMKSGNVVKTIVPSDNGMNFDVLSLVE